MWRPKPRRQPKLIATLYASLIQHTDNNATTQEWTAITERILADLDDAGYEILLKASRRKERSDLWAEQCRARDAIDQEKSCRAWAERLFDETRRLEARCSRLYGLAKAAGVPDSELHA